MAASLAEDERMRRKGETMPRSSNLNWTTICLTLLLAMLSLSWEGCPMLMVPSLAYQGYKYEKGKNASSPNSAHKNSSTPNPAANDNSIE
jgi:hypothetical protein